MWYQTTGTGNAWTRNIIIGGYTGSGGGYLQVTPPTGANLAVSNNLYYSYTGGTINSTGAPGSDSSPITGVDPQISGWCYDIAAGSPVFSAPLNFPTIAGNWGPPGYVIPQTGTTPSSPHSMGCSGGTGGGGTTESPYGGTAAAIPGTIQAENYDLGGQNVAYYDTTAGNSGGAYRTDDVDIEATTDTGGGYDIGYTAPGEWLAYTVNAVAGTYTYGHDHRSRDGRLPGMDDGQSAQYQPHLRQAHTQSRLRYRLDGYD
jgi:hypothetical protein